MLDKRFNNLEASLNYGTIRVDKEDAIYLGTKGKYGEDSCLAITVAEAKWLIKTLPEFVEAFEKEPYNKLMSIAKDLKSGKALFYSEIAREIEEIAKGLE